MKIYEIIIKENTRHWLKAKNNVEAMKLANFFKNLEIARMLDEDGKVTKLS